MIITRSPLRISLGGGGTDLPSYYREHTGFLVAAAINRHVHIVINRSILPEMILKYSQTERVTDVEQIQHPLVREAMKLVGIPAEGLEIAAMADIPAGTGLGSSGSFCTALLRGLHALHNGNPSAAEIGEQACHIEIDQLHEPVGKQDQYIAAVGGVTCFRFHPDGHVEYWPLRASSDTLRKLEQNVLLFFTGYTRSASEVLREQDTKTKASDSSMIQNLHFIKDLGLKSKDALEAGDLRGFAELMNVHWNSKKKRSGNMSNSRIDEWYDLGLKNGGLGGKLIGAGGGGFLMFYTENPDQLTEAMSEAGLQNVPFRFDFEGTRVISGGAPSPVLRPAIRRAA
ncbi:galactokinase [Gemmata sp. JC717]|uniref:Galactokinase n=1 Tax=Gemmata algarum TaxID=2975278 RepID=A0ABU5F7N8_9BACT|nr:galactokinase [Gemmata algarum]MDY3555898.1 galactokinase [Gemmata algarum]MDY3563300.1 galactokinase [Gemmata algarum]